MISFQIRHFRPLDRTAVFKLAADTAFFGDALEHYFEDRALFCEAFCAYYTDYEPQHAWVAEREHTVVGYLLGCVNTQTMNRIVARRIFPALVVGLMSGEYHLGKQSLRYLWGLFEAMLKREMLHPDLERFPAHLHLNVQADQRGGGIGKALLEHYLAQLRAEGVKGVHLKTTSENEVACFLYEKVGFNLLEARRTGLWKPWLGRAIENRCYAISL
ncbi:MAG: GCN5-related N-acetyltransferase [Anaerolineae bacterium]|jgi:ribosomal protein S18 acetylase RimI-like enzyme|nr:MAG: GCN5-related N-acetyltransferase [Anaerolineae bacterium]